MISSLFPQFFVVFPKVFDPTSWNPCRWSRVELARPPRCWWRIRQVAGFFPLETGDFSCFSQHKWWFYQQKHDFFLQKLWFMHWNHDLWRLKWGFLMISHDLTTFGQTVTVASMARDLGRTNCFKWTYHSLVAVKLCHFLNEQWETWKFFQKNHSVRVSWNFRCSGQPYAILASGRRLTTSAVSFRCILQQVAASCSAVTPL